MPARSRETATTALARPRVWAMSRALDGSLARTLMSEPWQVTTSGNPARRARRLAAGRVGIGVVGVDQLGPCLHGLLEGRAAEIFHQAVIQTFEQPWDGKEMTTQDSLVSERNPWRPAWGGKKLAESVFRGQYLDMRRPGQRLRPVPWTNIP